MWKVAENVATRAWSVARDLFRDPFMVLAIGVLVAVAFVSIFADVLAPHDPNSTNLLNTLEGPSRGFLLGTDDIGRDTLSRMLSGGRVSLMAGLFSTAIAFTIGVPLGLIAGYVGGFVDGLIMRVNDALMTIPAVVLAIALVGVSGPGLRNVVVSMGVVFVPRFTRVVRASTLSVREETYVTAARVIGTPIRRIVLRHVVPGILSPLAVQATLTIALAILTEAALSFLGLGVVPPQASWGGMLGRAFRFLAADPWSVVLPGTAILVTVLAFNLLGDGLRDRLLVQRGDQV